MHSFCAQKVFQINIVRIGSKAINKDKLYQTIDKIMELRSRGVSQQEIADRIGTDRTFVSRLESRERSGRVKA